MFLLLFSIIFKVSIALESSFPLTVLPLATIQNADFNSTFRMETSKFGLATPEIDCEVLDVLCPQLVQIFHVSDQGLPRLITKGDVEEDGNQMEIIDEAGYIGNWPGYCGTDNRALVEMYSPILKAYQYLTTWQEVQKARNNSDKNNWYPNKVLGYLYASEPQKRTVTYPFNAIRPLSNPVFNRIIVRFQPIIRVKKGTLVANTVSLESNDYLEGYSIDMYLNISLVNRKEDVKLLESSCGKLILMMETFDTVTSAYRIRDPKTGELGRNEDIIKGAGFLFKEESSAKRCLGDIQPVFEYSNPSNSNEYHYVGSYEDAKNYEENRKWIRTGLLGYSSWGNFGFAKR